MLKLSRYDDLGKLIVRLMVGVLILFHGVHKVLNPGSLDSIRKMLISANLPSLLAYGVYLGEIVGALMVILGTYSRIGGLLIAGNMLFALGLAHRASLRAGHPSPPPWCCTTRRAMLTSTSTMRPAYPQKSRSTSRCRPSTCQPPPASREEPDHTPARRRPRVPGTRRVGDRVRDVDLTARDAQAAQRRALVRAGD